MHFCWRKHKERAALPESHTPYFFYLDAICTTNHLDALKSTILMTDDAGTIKNKYGYDEFGTPNTQNTEEVFNRYTFTGQAWDATSGLYNYKARYYNPKVGRFLTQDTWRGSPWAPWTQNLYAYVGNNPVNLIDPTGHKPFKEDPRENDPEVNKQYAEQKRKEPVFKTDDNNKVIVLQCPTCVANFGHTAIITVLDGRAHYWSFQTKNGDASLLSVPGDMSDFPLAADPNDIQALLKEINHWRKSHGAGVYEYALEFVGLSSGDVGSAFVYLNGWEGDKHNVLTHNCVQAVQGALKAAGIYTPPSDIRYGPVAGIAHAAPNSWFLTMQAYRSSEDTTLYKYDPGARRFDYVP